ncbi:MAG: protease inhibitor I42 family protein [Saprospiraceae bacterium]|nr:protease inhibitor I42 family protein [Saprospiraceae bacterium]MDW8485295.1 protease inhibitor I42 family protein [Saprospiraceae bacterium]
MHPTYLLVFLALLFGCSEKSPYQTIRVKRGEVFEIKLEAQIATGYRWRLMDSLDTRYVELLNTQYQEATRPDVDGGMGTEVWSFRANAAGKAVIRFLYNPAWQKDKTADSKERIFEIIID